MDVKLRPYLAELFGTYAVVLAGAGTLCATFLPYDARANPALAVALAQGFTLAVVLTATLYVSPGCLNPAVTLSLWVLKRLDGGRAVGLIVAQLLGAVLAGLTVRTLFHDDTLRDARMGTPHLKALLAPDGTASLNSLLTGIAVEAGLTFLVAFAVFATVIDRRAPKVGGLMVGMALTAAVLFGFHLTGGAANPASWLGPVVWELSLPGAETMRPLADHPVYWVGPVVGALLAGVLYVGVFLPPEKP